MFSASLNKAQPLSRGGADTTCTCLNGVLEVSPVSCFCTGLLLVLMLSVLLPQMVLLLLLLLLDREDGVRDAGIAGLLGEARSSLALCA